jgi:hypothetical protein
MLHVRRKGDGSRALQEQARSMILERITERRPSELVDADAH